MELICAIAGATNGQPADKKTTGVCASVSLVSVGASDEHKQALGENGHARLELRADGPSLGGALAGTLKSGARYLVSIKEIK